ncbi:MAG: hypothetical protein LBR35_02175 [Rickettsiales bacterium]|nr:hypothetical protein [Rickettsiales bacterium]
MEKIFKSVLWTNLKKHKLYLDDESVASLNKIDEKRVSDFAVKTEDMIFDFSNNIIDQKAMDGISKIFSALNVDKKIEGYFEESGEFSYHFFYRSLREDKYKHNSKFVYGEVEKLFFAIEKIEEKVENKEIDGKYFSDFVVVLNADNKAFIKAQYESLKPFKRVGRNLHFVSCVQDLESVLRRIFLNNTFFIFADKELKDELFLQTFSRFKDIKGFNKQTAFVCQNAKFALKLDENAENIVSYSSLVEDAFNFFALQLLPFEIIFGKDVLRQYLNGLRDIDLQVRNDFENSIPYKMAGIYELYKLFDECQINNLVIYTKTPLAPFVATLYEQLMSLKGKKYPAFGYQTFCPRNKRFLRDITNKDKKTLNEIIYFNNTDDNFLSDISFLSKKEAFFNVLAFKEYSPQNIGRLFGIYEYFVIILKLLIDGNLKSQSMEYEFEVNAKNKSIANIANFLGQAE